MKKVKISIDDLIAVLEAMRDTGGTSEVIIFDYEGMPAFADAADTENIVTFASDSPDGDELDNYDGDLH